MIRSTVAALGFALVGSFLPSDAVAQEPKPAAPAPAAPAPKPAADESGFKDFKQKIGYTIGIEMGKNFKDNNVELDLDTFMQGMKDGFGGAKPKLPKPPLRFSTRSAPDIIITSRARR